LRARLRPVLLRRLKGDVAPELPERIEERIDCEMGEANGGFTWPRSPEPARRWAAGGGAADRSGSTSSPP